MNTTIRNIDDKTFHELKVEATKERVTVGQATTQAIKLWLKTKREKGKKRSLKEIKPISFGKENKKLSEEIKEVLYGA
ncbi:MAG: hypothetical protein U9N35_00635 [Euryarchaeota archaeon]|nr:hypothetical protein [Euryarchaeota archaeon]